MVIAKPLSTRGVIDLCMIPPVADQFIAGKTITTALTEARHLNEDGVIPILNQLGEHYTELGDVEDAVSEYCELIQAIAERDITAEISLKPSQLGWDINSEIFEANALRIVDKASDEGIFVWIDMESAETVDDTLDTYISLIEKFPGQVGVCLQANLKRTPDDIERLSNHSDVSIRLVKGAYSESPEISYTNPETVDEQYKMIIQKSMQEIDGRVAVGTHDSAMIQTAISASQENRTTEIQMLRGVREDYQRDLADDYRVRQYVPYGEEWLSYTYRRIRERPRNIFLIGRAVINRFKI